MILNKELEKHYLPYTESEKLFKTFYELVKSNKPTDTFLDSIDNIDIRSFMQNVVETGNYHFSKKCDLFFIYKEDITVSKHIRYYPYFMHKHYFYEIIYQLTGTSRHIINNMDISMEEGNLLIIPPSSFHAAGVLDDSIIVNIIVKPNSLDVLLSDLLPENNIFETFFSQTGIFHSDINYIYIPSTEDKSFRNLSKRLSWKISIKGFVDFTKENTSNACTLPSAKTLCGYHESFQKLQSLSYRSKKHMPVPACKLQECISY